MRKEELKAISSGRNICQIGIMCEDIYQTMEQMMCEYQIGPWDFYEHSEDTLQNPLLRQGICEPHFKFYCAVANMQNIQLELIQPLYGIPFYSEHVAKYGTSLHHFKEKVAPELFEKTIQEYGKKGMEPVFGAGLFESKFCFLNSKQKLGFWLEIGNGQSPSSVPAEWKKVYPKDKIK